MGMTNKKRKQQKKTDERQHTVVDPPNQEILDSIGSPNAWTPAIEDAWLNELDKIQAVEIYKKFPPIRKPPNVGRRGKNTGWGDT